MSCPLFLCAMLAISSSTMPVMAKQSISAAVRSRLGEYHGIIPLDRRDFQGSAFAAVDVHRKFQAETGHADRASVSKSEWLILFCPSQMKVGVTDGVSGDQNCDAVRTALRQLNTEWRLALKAPQQRISIGEVDCTSNGGLCSQQSSFPRLKPEVARYRDGARMSAWSPTVVADTGVELLEWISQEFGPDVLGRSVLQATFASLLSVLSPVFKDPKMAIVGVVLVVGQLVVVGWVIVTGFELFPDTCAAKRGAAGERGAAAIE